MVATNTLNVPPLTSILLFLIVSAHAIPTQPLPIATQTIPISARADTNATATAAPTFLSTDTDNAGHVYGCTSLSSRLHTSGASVSTEAWCVGGGPYLSTVTAAASSWASKISAIQPISAPASGCATGTKQDGSGEVYCTCAGGADPSASPPSSVGTILGFSSGTLTTACATAGALPTGYVEVPPINYESGKKDFWALPPEASVGKCTSGEVLDPQCWESLNLDLYVKWWWPAFKNK